MKPVERKLYRVIVKPKWYMKHADDAQETYYVEAENHEQAANNAVQRYHLDTKLSVSATHVPFAQISTVGKTQHTTEFKGDGTQEFSPIYSGTQAVWRSLEAMWWPFIVTFFFGGLFSYLVFGPK